MGQKKYQYESIVRNVLLILTAISLLILSLNWTYLIYQNQSVEQINDFLVHYVNGWVLWVDNILIYVLAGIYIVLGIQSKKEVVLKVSFSIFSILTTMIVMTFIVNVIAELFGVFS